MGIKKEIEAAINSTFQGGHSKSLAPIESAVSKRVHALISALPEQLTVTIEVAFENEQAAALVEL